MKMGDALSAYRTQRKELTAQRQQLVNQQKALEKRKPASEEEKAFFSKEAATLELSLENNQQMFDKNQKVMDQLMEQYSAIWNAEAARQQGDAMEDYAEEMGKILEVARRIAKGGKVPATDEKKVMEFSMELYMAVKNAAMMNKMKDKKEYDSLWDDEEEQQEEYDPQGKAESAEVNVELPDVELSGGAEISAE